MRFVSSKFESRGERNSPAVELRFYVAAKCASVNLVLWNQKIQNKPLHLNLLLTADNTYNAR